MGQRPAPVRAQAATASALVAALTTTNAPIDAVARRGCRRATLEHVLPAVPSTRGALDHRLHLLDVDGAGREGPPLAKPCDELAALRRRTLGRDGRERLAGVGERLALAVLELDESLTRTGRPEADPLELGVVQHVRALVDDVVDERPAVYEVLNVCR